MADIIYDALRTLTRTEYGDNDESAAFVNKFRDMLIDSGLHQNLNNWRNAYYHYRLPQKMSFSTVNIQIKNFEREILKMREESFCSGWTRKERTLNAFDISQNHKGHTVLVPTTHLSTVILKNTFDEQYQLPKVPDGAFEKLSKQLESAKIENDKLKEKIIESQNIISQNENKELELLALQPVLNHLKKTNKQLMAQRDEAQCMVIGLCNRFGLQVEINNRGVTCYAPDNKGKRKGRKNRISPIVTYTFGDFDSPIEDQFIKDLTTEGVEPNPGPTFDFFVTVATFMFTYELLNQFCLDANYSPIEAKVKFMSAVLSAMISLTIRNLF